MRPKLVFLVLLALEIVIGEVKYKLGHFNFTIQKWSVDVFSVTHCSLACTLAKKYQYFEWDDTPSGGPRCHMVQSTKPSTTPVWLYKRVITLTSPLSVGTGLGWRTCHNTCKGLSLNMYPVPQQQSGLDLLFDMFGPPLFVYLNGLRLASTNDFYDPNGELVLAADNPLYAAGLFNEPFDRNTGLWTSWQTFGDIMSEPNYTATDRVCLCV